MPKRQKLDLVPFRLRLERGQVEKLRELYPKTPIAILIRRLLHLHIKGAEHRIEDRVAAVVSSRELPSEELDGILSSDEVPRHSMTGNPKAGDP
jgi:hypothetical protein